ncbi:hypothetical protein APSETT445_003834 [Aspergillus pseudonomiae]
MSCSHLIPILYRKWKKLRLAVHSHASETLLKTRYPDAEVVHADMTQVEDICRIISGVTIALFIGPAFHLDETRIGYTMIDAARDEARNGSFRHFIYSSVLHTQLRKLMNHDCKRYVEEYLIEWGLNYTIMQPSHFLDMFPVESLFQQPEPTYNATFDPNTTFSFTVLRDLAEAFVKVIEEREKHYLAEYMICSTCPTSYTDVINTLSQLSDTHINVVTQEFYEGTRFVQNMVSNDSKDCHRVT